MASPWDRVGQAASVMQVTGVDAFGLVSMIVQAAHTARCNRDLCQQLAQHVLVVAGLLRKLDIPALRQHLETRRPLEQLDDALFRAYKLVRSCTQQQENRSRLYQMFTGAEVASKLRQAQEEIDRYINLIPMITLVAVVGDRQASNEVHEDVSNDDAPTQRNRFSLQHVTQSLTLEERQQGFTIDTEARRTGREARRNTWHLVTGNVKNGMSDQMGRYFTYEGSHKSTGNHLLAGARQIFSYKELCQATREFSQVESLGGSFYRGLLHDHEGLQVAIKRVSLDSSLEVGSERAKMVAEDLSIRSQLRHRGIVRLIGWCHEANELLLVYELLTNTCLGNLLHSSGYMLTWSIRNRIIHDIGDALLYMQKECSLVVVHRNIKPSSVMLDSSFNARLGDFGLAHAGIHHLTTRFGLGTVGYLARETAEDFRFTAETDVYSFGVLVLEIASGRPAVNFSEDDGYYGGRSCFYLVQWVWELYVRGALLDAADPGLHGEFDADEMERALIVGLWCAHYDYRDRPSMVRAMTALRKLEDPPPQLKVPWEIAAGGELTSTTTSDDESVQ